MLQRPLDAYQGLAEVERETVDAWLVRVGGLDAMQLQVKNRFTVRDFQICLEASAPPETPGEALEAT